MAGLIGQTSEQAEWDTQWHGPKAMNQQQIPYAVPVQASSGYAGQSSAAGMVLPPQQVVVPVGSAQQAGMMMAGQQPVVMMQQGVVMAPAGSMGQCRSCGMTFQRRPGVQPTCDEYFRCPNCRGLNSADFGGCCIVQ